MTRNERFGSRLRELRKEKELSTGRKWTSEAVAKEIGISQTAYTNYENALRMPNLDGIEKLAAFYDKTPAYIACFTDNPGNTQQGSLLASVALSDRAAQVSQAELGDIGLSHAFLSRKGLTENDIYIDSVTDNAMAPELNRDDLIVIQRQHIAAQDVVAGVYLVENPNGVSFIRWVKPEIDGSVKIYPNNQTHFDTFKLDRDAFSQFTVLGSIVAVIKNPHFDTI
ncbi:XRE family transcriptional regulator [Photobacterium leiognathi]|uniref:XRE family transcriptional regulator n=1 Tax=Photobacterium leiognathi TaxID=553611 RepID=UPI00273881A0|nr:XRE family transcriptional regulator [Photobacterium leiognathi]